jgi:hypothetical protein
MKFCTSLAAIVLLSVLPSASAKSKAAKLIEKPFESGMGGVAERTVPLRTRELAARQARLNVR